MPRIAEVREAAEPSSPRQKARHQEILRVAADLAAQNGLDRVQMAEVAKGAGVALGTLYRYFPSKTYLFTAVMADQVDWLDRNTPVPDGDRDPGEVVHTLLVNAGRRLLRRPALAAALMQSVNSAHAAQVPDAGRIDRTFRALVLRTLGIVNPTAHDVTCVSLLVHCWYGLLISALNGRTAHPDAEDELRIACRLLAGSCTSGGASGRLAS